MVEGDGHILLIDIGTLARIRDGSIAVRSGIDRFTAQGVIFTDELSEKFDAVILATGFRPDLRRLIVDVRRRIRSTWDAARDGAGNAGARALLLRPGHVADGAAAGDRN
ncbi:MAG: hypothetical protein AAAB35_02200 [Phyllobacterium sp.]|uniref:hypothetical protein n=1 Tax=Phyllobacterium sp. TaxID=1871046 RepID=UPI0030EFAF4A